jgi:hypothetical protein
LVRPIRKAARRRIRPDAELLLECEYLGAAELDAAFFDATTCLATVDARQLDDRRRYHQCC